MLRFTKSAVACVLGLFGLTACETYTSQPLCNDSNATMVDGLAGSYYMAMLDENFNRQVENITITVDAGSARLKFKSQKRNVGFDLWLCHVGTRDIVETQDESTGLYSQAKLTVTNIGLQFSPFYYDRAQLTDRGIANDIIDMGVNKLLKTFKKATDSERAVAIDNSSVDGATLLNLSLQGPYSINLIRR